MNSNLKKAIDEVNQSLVILSKLAIALVIATMAACSLLFSAMVVYGYYGFIASVVFLLGTLYAVAIAVTYWVNSVEGEDCDLEDE